jgi:hypothetical protein
MRASRRWRREKRAEIKWINHIEWYVHVPGCCANNGKERAGCCARKERKGIQAGARKEGFRSAREEGKIRRRRRESEQEEEAVGLFSLYMSGSARAPLCMCAVVKNNQKLNPDKNLVSFSKLGKVKIGKIQM